MDPTRPETRRAQRARRLRYARRRWAVSAGALLAVALIAVPVTIAATGASSSPDRDGAASLAGGAPSASSLPVPAQQGDAPPPADDDAADGGADGADAASDDVCADPAVQQALASGSDTDVVTAVGGGEAFRAAVAGGDAACLSLTEAHRTWVVVNKLTPLDPLDYRPDPLVFTAGMQRTDSGYLRGDVATALAELADAAVAEGAGVLGLNSGFRSYATQVSTYDSHVRGLGQEGADLVSARPGHSEHQTGLAVDVVACGDGCGGLEAFGGTPQSDWVAANSWRFGFIVRYAEGATGTTGYEWEPWHLRYLGVDLATAYHQGGYATLEDFFGLDAAPGYHAHG